MLVNKMEQLESIFKLAKENDSEFIGLRISIPGCDKDEIIINPRANFDFKLDYYKNTYDDLLVHKHSADIIITAVSHGSDFEVLQHKLLTIYGE